MTKKKAVLFAADGDKDLRVIHTELRNADEFAGLTKEELIFVYNYAGASSPVINLLPEKRIIRCLEILKGTLNHTQQLEYAKLNFPDKIKLAIDKMFKFDLGIRLRAKGIIEKIFDNIESIADTKPEISADGSSDAEAMKRYIDMAKGITAIMPTLVLQLENGYGIKYAAIPESSAEEQKAQSTVTWESIVSSGAKSGSK